MPTFPSEKNDKANEEIRQAVSEQSQPSGLSDETAAIQLSDASISTHSEAPGDEKHPLGFLSPPQAADEMGRLSGYRVLKLLGEGGMGLVFEAEDLRLERRVALKVMKPEIAAKEQHRARFVREARTAAKVEHDHICPIYQVGEENGVPFIAMPFLKGEPLDVRLKRQKPLPIAEAIRIGREVAEGLAAAHDAGMVHRDIKPGNVWLEEMRIAERGAKKEGRTKFRVRILDFGLARLAIDDVHLTQTGAIMGTPAYMAPEQARGKSVDHRADLFSLGVLLYEMTTGRRPFTGNDTMSILTSLAIDEPTAPSLSNLEIPSALSDLIMQLLSKSPEKRPADGREVAESLLAILMQTTQPLVEAMPSSTRSAAPPLATAVDATSVDPWSAIDDAKSSVAPAGPVSRDAKPQTAPHPVSRDAQALRSGASNRFKIVIAVALLFVIGGGLAAYKLFFETKDGTLVVEVDGDADVRFKNGELQIYGEDGKLKYTLSPSEKNKTLPPGKYLVKIIGADGLKIDAPEFTMEKNGKASVRVTADAVVVAKKDKGAKDGNVDGPSAHFALDFSAELKPGCAHVVLPTDMIKPTAPLTIEMYVTPRALMGGSCNLWHIKQLQLKPSNSQWKWYVYRGMQGQDVVTSEGAWKPGKRVHLAATSTGAEIRLFLDGELVGSQAVTTPLTNVVDFHHLGGSQWDISGLIPFDGVIDQVRISKAARYTNAFVPDSRMKSDSKTLALYNFDEGSGEVLKDSSGNGHHGKIVGAKWVKVDGTPVRSPIALRFAGQGHYLETVDPKARIQMDQPWTMEGWFLPEKCEQPAFKGMTLCGSASFYLNILQHPNQGLRWVANRTPILDAFYSDQPVALGRWAHLAMVHDGKTLTLYVNGVKQSQANRAELPAQAISVAIGPNKWGATGEQLGYHGLIREVRVSKSARYQGDFKPAERFERDNDTVILCHFDEAQGDILRDSSGNKYDYKIVGAKWVKADGTTIGSFPPLDDAWLKAVVAMMPAQRLEAVVAELKRRNPEYDGKIKPATIDKDGVWTELEFLTDNVADISPVRALTGLRKLVCGGSDFDKLRLADLSPLKGMQLTDLDCTNSKVADLTPLAGMKLATLRIWGTQVSDLSPLEGMPLTELCFPYAPVSNLAPLKGMPLTGLHFSYTKVSDLSPLKGMPLTFLWCDNTPVSDLSPLKDMKLTTLFCKNTKVADLTWLRVMPLKQLGCDIELAKSHAEMLRSIKSLEQINGKPAAAFWKEVSAAPFPPLDPAWLKAVADMKGDEQVAAVKAELMKRNPGFDGKIEHKIDNNGIVWELEFVTDNVTDIAPMRALKGLSNLKCGGTKSPMKAEGKLADLSPLKDLNLSALNCDNTQVADLSPLKGMNLKDLHCTGTQVSDLSALKDMKLTGLACGSTKVSDLSPLKDMMLVYLSCDGTLVSDLSPLKNMKLTYLGCGGTKVSDLSLLKGMPLRELDCDAMLAERHAAILRSIKTLEKINTKPAAEFLK